MENKYLDKIDNIANYKDTTAYVSLLRYFKAINFPFPCISIVPIKEFYRVRLHKNKEELFKNESDLSYIQNILEIKDFNRCNEPLQSVFYCSDCKELSLGEVINNIDKKTLRGYKYYTISTWKLIQEAFVSFILTQGSKEKNLGLLELSREFDKILDDPALIGDTQELKEFLRELHEHFGKPFSTNDKAYYLSAALSNYLFNTMDLNNKQIEGLVYPTCTGSKVSTSGLNYAFLPKMIGKGRKIQFSSAKRISLTNPNDWIKCNGSNENGILCW